MRTNCVSLKNNILIASIQICPSAAKLKFGVNHLSTSTRSILLWVIVIMLAVAGLLFTTSVRAEDAAFAGANTGASATNNAISGQRHPLEIEALTEPRLVLEKLAAARAAVSAPNFVELAKLDLAEANACRVIANWQCQRRAALTAITNADKTNSVYLQVRARINEGRAHASLGEFNAASRALAQAQQRLGNAKDNQLFPDIMLAYSSISFRLGKLDESLRYAADALPYASAVTQPEMRIRLLRNMSRAAAKIEKVADANAYLEQATNLLQGINDPKLVAEILLERARTAHAANDVATVEAMGERITSMAGSLKNSQLSGLGIETTAQALQMRGQTTEAINSYNRASDAYATLNLYSDEMRAVRASVELQMRGAPSAGLVKAVARLNQLTDKVAVIERDSASTDFAERLRYAQSDAELTIANAKTETEHMRAENSENKFRYTLLAIGLALILFLVVLGMYFQQRRYAENVRQQNLEMEQVLMQTSHDLRNPLNGILGISDLLLSAPLAVDQKNKIQAIRDAGLSLNSLAQDLLDRGRIKGGTLTLNPESTDIKALIANLGTLYQPLAAQKNLGLHVQIDASLPAIVSIDAHRLQQVLGNLFGNALKFSDRGNIALTVSTANVGGEAMNPSNIANVAKAAIRFEVRDNGPGIAKADQERLFQPFQRGDTTRKNATGAGLGLAISKDLVHLMGGKLEVLSEVNKGAAFFFTLRLPIIAEQVIAVTQPIVDKAEAADSMQILRALIVDDEAISVMVLRHQIGLLGHKVEACESPMEALTTVGIARFDVVLLDYEMEGMNGPELAAKLRALHGNSPAMPRLIMVSGHPPDANIVNRLVDDWLVKPVRLEPLKRAMDKRNWQGTDGSPSPNVHQLGSNPR